MKKGLQFALGALLLATAFWAPEALAVDNNANLWLMYFGDFKVDDTPWGIHFDTQVRRADVGLSWQQLLIQTGMNYDVNNRIQLGFGHGYMNTYPYGDFPLPRSLDEHRLYEQISIDTPVAGIALQHRFRLEQRWIENATGPDNRRQENRFAYRIKTRLPIFREDSDWGLVLSNEIFANFGGAVGHNSFDQNRAYGGINYKLSKSCSLDLGFMEQTLQHRDGRVWEHNHTLMFAISSKLGIHRN